ncbi:MAG: multiheme c-type cytochrome [Anaerolineae bacterium]|nr:multiheme c-type cytochrome [Anaerolineae bacterium]
MKISAIRNIPRGLVLGIVGVVLVFGLSLAIVAVARSLVLPEEGPVDALATSRDECVVCHRRTSPGIVDQYSHSTMAAAEVTCRDCHEVESDYPDAVEHEGTFVLGTPTTAMCEDCHENEVAEYYQSRHSLPAYVAYAGAQELTPELLTAYEGIPEGSFNPDQERNAIYHIEGPDVTPFTCEACHNIGKPAADGSVGECQQCHLRHQFSLEQARRPETCNACHIGPDHPQFEIFVESPHGIAYATSGDDWNWDADAGTLDTLDFPAPTCAICHMSSFGGQGTTHDVGDRLTWYLFSAVSERRPTWQENKTNMQSVCGECHNDVFIDEFYTAADGLVEAVNAWVLESRDIIQPLVDNGLLTEAPFDEPIDFVFFDLWHHWGRTAKFGAWMQGPDYSQWHGVYELLRELAELREMVAEKLHEAGIEP